MTYSIKASALHKDYGTITIDGTKIQFGITDKTEALANPAEIFLASLSACILKNVERFSDILNFQYSKAELTIEATRQEKPPMIKAINYELKIYSNDAKLNLELLQRNIEKFGTIYNTVKGICIIKGKITKAQKAI